MLLPRNKVRERSKQLRGTAGIRFPSISSQFDHSVLKKDGKTILNVSDLMTIKVTTIKVWAHFESLLFGFESLLKVFWKCLKVFWKSFEGFWKSFEIFVAFFPVQCAGLVSEASIEACADKTGDLQGYSQIASCRILFRKLDCRIVVVLM